MATDFPEEIFPVKNLVNLLKLHKGCVTIKSDGQPAFSLQFKGDNVLLDIIDTSFFDFAYDADNIGLFSKLKTAKKFAQFLNDNHLTFTILRKGKEALRLGYETHPTLSRLITRSNNIQIDSVKEIAKLKHDMDK